MKNILRSQKGFGLLEMLVTAVFLLLLAAYALKTYYGNSASKKHQEAVSKNSIDTAKDKVDVYNKAVEERAKKTEQLNQNE